MPPRDTLPLISYSSSSPPLLCVLFGMSALVVLWYCTVDVIIVLAARRMLVEAVQRTGCSWMLVDGGLPHGPMRDSYICSSWVRVSPTGPMIHSYL